MFNLKQLTIDFFLSFFSPVPISKAISISGDMNGPGQDTQKAVISLARLFSIEN